VAVAGAGGKILVASDKIRPTDVNDGTIDLGYLPREFYDSFTKPVIHCLQFWQDNGNKFVSNEVDPGIQARG